MAAFGKPNPTGRSSGILSGRESKLRSPPRGEQWCWLTGELLASAAWRALSPNARKFIDFLLIEHTNHAGRENGNLVAPHVQLTEYGLSRRLVSEAVREAVFLGFVRIAEKGRLSSGGYRHPSRYRLTFYASHDGAPATNEWRGITSDRIDEWRSGRRRMRKVGAGNGVTVRCLTSGKI